MTPLAPGLRAWIVILLLMSFHRPPCGLVLPHRYSRKQANRDHQPFMKRLRKIAMLILLVGALGCLLSFCVPVVSTISEKAYITTLISNARQIVLALKIYASDHEGRYPETLEELVAEKIITVPEILIPLIILISIPIPSPNPNPNRRPRKVSPRPNPPGRLPEIGRISINPNVKWKKNEQACPQLHRGGVPGRGSVQRRRSREPAR